MESERNHLSAGTKAPPVILLVDDDKLQLQLSTIRLREAGYEVKPVNSPAEALRVAIAEPPDAILSDVLMGEIDGFGLCRRLREHPQLTRVPVVLTSAHYDDDRAQHLAERVGASALVCRSPGFDAELSAIRSVLGEQTRHEATASVDIYEEHLRTNANQISRLLGEAQEAEGRYRALFESANDAIAVLGGSGIILEANERWRHVLGMDPLALVGRHLLDLSPRGQPTARQELEAALQAGSGRIYGVPVERNDGNKVYLDFSVSTVQMGSRELVFAIGRDVTGRFLSARALAAAEEKYRSLVERLPDVVMTTNRQGCVFVTSNVLALTGFSPDEIQGQSIAEWQSRIHPDDEAAFAAALQVQRKARPELTFDLEYRWRRKDGQWIWLRQRIIAIYEREGVAFIDSLVSDVTERRRLEESLRQSQKMEAIGQLTGGIAHDFNNSLATILANSEFLLHSLRGQEEPLADAREIKQAAERAAGLTRQLLAFSRRQVLEPKITDLNVIIANLERMLCRMLGEDIKLIVSLAPELWHVQVDRAQIEQVVLNLAVNARDAMATGGTLTITTSNQFDAGHGQLVMLRVQDTGVGIDEATQSRIFEPFFTTKEPGRGTGLGLATCHGIVAQSGGQIRVTSELGRGATFDVLLPRIDSELSEESSEAPIVGGGNELVLLVEDDSPLRSAAQRMLEYGGYRVLVARDSQDAIELAEQHRDELALLLTDVVMPQISGPSLALLVKQRAPDVKILFMSGYTDHATLAEGVLRAQAPFIQKPFSPQALARKLQEALGR